MNSSGAGDGLLFSLGNTSIWFSPSKDSSLKDNTTLFHPAFQLPPGAWGIPVKGAAPCFFSFPFYFSWLLPLWSFFFFPLKEHLPSHRLHCLLWLSMSQHPSWQPSLPSYLIPLYFHYLLNKITDSSNRAQEHRPCWRVDAELHSWCNCRIIPHLQQRVAEPLTLFLWDCSWWAPLSLWCDAYSAAPRLPWTLKQFTQVADKKCGGLQTCPDVFIPDVPLLSPLGFNLYDTSFSPMTKYMLLNLGRMHVFIRVVWNALLLPCRRTEEEMVCFEDDRQFMLAYVFTHASLDNLGGKLKWSKVLSLS